MECHPHHARGLWAADPDPASLAEAAAMFKALADPERLRLLVRLAAGEACVSDLADAGRVTTVSARLQSLHAVRLVTRRRDARHVYYALADAHVLELVANAMAHAGEAPDVPRVGRASAARPSRPIPKEGTR